MRIVTVTNQKGGVGKTTLVCHLALAGAERGLRIGGRPDSRAMPALRWRATPRSPANPAALRLRTPLARRLPQRPSPAHGHQHFDEVDQRWA
jgi:hypothetical protein